jgi:hypothetical protein
MLSTYIACEIVSECNRNLSLRPDNLAARATLPDRESDVLFSAQVAPYVEGICGGFRLPEFSGHLICECNAAMERCMGQPREKLIGTSPDQLSPERPPCGRLSSEMAGELIAEALSKGATHFTWTLRFFYGAAAPIEVTLLRAELGGKPMTGCFWRDLRENEKIRPSKQAARAGAALGQIGEWVDRLNTLVADIAGSSHEQTPALTEVISAVNPMDRTTQQNAAMVEQSKAASQSLAGSALRLSDLVGRFRLAEAASSRRPAAPPARAAGRGR